MADLKVGDSTLASLAADVDATFDSIEAQLQLARTHFADMAEIWHGDSSDTFQTTMDSWDQQTVKALQALTKLAQGLRNAQKSFAETETANTTDLTRYFEKLGSIGN